MSTENRFPSLDGIRAICISMVIFGHVANNYPFSKDAHEPIRNIALLGVAVFFVISGFLITTLLLREQEKTGTISLRKFYLRRAFRILPVTCLYLVFVALANYLFHLGIPAISIIGSLFFLANVPYFQGSWFVGHFWSLSVEEQYYLIFPTLLKRFSSRMPGIIICFLSLIIFLKVFPQSMKWSPLADTLAYVMTQMDGVLVGALLGLYYFHSRQLQELIQNNTGWVSTATFALFILVNVFAIKAINSTVSDLLIGVLILCAVSARRGWMYWILNTRLMSTLGKLSFSMYVWQQFFTDSSGRFGSYALPPKNILLILIVSALSYYFFESFFLRLKQRWRVVK